MNVSYLQDRLDWGLNRAANILGKMTDAYRPEGSSTPLDRSNRFLRLHVVFSRCDGNFDQSVGYGSALWRGYFDSSYTRVGDYLVQNEDIWFIVSQQSLLPVLCVKANKTISIARQLTPDNTTSSNLVPLGSTINVISEWPVSMLGIGTEGRSATQLPGDTRIPTVTALLPSIHGQTIEPADIITDEYGASGIVVATELSDLGWRLNVRSVTT
jgi:hypothetical protein